VDTYAKFRKVFGLNNAFQAINAVQTIDKDFDKGRKHFLFFSGGGNVHKGLDLLLEAFSNIDLHLHICQNLQPDFSFLYKNELNNLPNIHFYGFVKMRSPKFLNLINRCNWVISASCVEGQPGAIIECMGYGLIPILSDENNIDLEDWGLRLTNCQISNIRNTVLQASLMPTDECRRRVQRVVTAAKQLYSVEAFRTSFMKAVQEIVSSKNSATI